MRCDLCNEILDYGQQFICLNRWCISVNGTVRMMQKDSRNGYTWDPEATKGGVLPLCWPHCASTYIDGQIIELAYDQKQKRHG
jgi:hypothetical protein